MGITHAKRDLCRKAQKPGALRAPLRRIHFRDWRGLAVQLLDSAGALVDPPMKNPRVRPQFRQPNLLDVSPIPELSSPVEVLEPLEDPAFCAVFDTGAEALVVVSSRGIVRAAAANGRARESFLSSCR